MVKTRSKKVFSKSPKTNQIVGKRVPNIDSNDKVKGRAEYFSDLELPGMLYGSVVRSRFAHAKIKNINIDKARKVPGVKKIITPEDCPDTRWGPVKKDQQILPVDGIVRYKGEEVVAIAASSKEAAEKAASLVEIDYKKLPCILDPNKALDTDAILVHSENGNNIASNLELERGDPEKGFKEAEVIYNKKFKTPLVHHCYIEPVYCLANPSRKNALTLWLPAHMPYSQKNVLSDALQIPESNIRIRQTHVGGSFGGKISNKLYVICALLSLKAGAPVKMGDDREEAFEAAYPRPSMEVEIKLGISGEGRFTAKEMNILADNGAFCDEAPVIIISASTTPDNVYQLENIKTKAKLVYTNKVPTGAFRGFGNPQTTFAFESAIDDAAKDLGWDPIELRRKNLIGANSLSVHGWKISSCGIKECIDTVEKKSNWNKEKLATENRDKKRGIGFACCTHKSGARRHPEYEGSAAMVKVTGSGNVIVLCGETDLGQGARTTWAQIAAEELMIPLHNVSVHPLDTDITPVGIGTFASRVTTLAGNAVKLAVEDAKSQLKKMAAQLLNINKDEIKLTEDGFMSEKDPSKTVKLEDAARKAEVKAAGQSIVGKGSFIAPNVIFEDTADDNEEKGKTAYGNYSLTYSFAANVVEVEVDMLTGEIDVISVIAAHDVGKAINPLMAEGQIEGGIAQGIGYALFEELKYSEEGKLLNNNFADYKIPTIADIPEIEIDLIETMDDKGPYGAKGIAEMSLVPVAPAVVNAVCNALEEERITNIPITPEKVVDHLN